MTRTYRMKLTLQAEGLMKQDAMREIRQKEKNLANIGMQAALYSESQKTKNVIQFDLQLPSGDII